jgi:hypothetical protein
MSTKNSLELAASSNEVCACCGIAEVDDITLRLCDGGCDLVKYCSDECQENHREQHEEECKTRKAELHDKKLFTQPDGNHRGECPICFLPMPLDYKKTTFMSCCCKTICKGCEYANLKRQMEEGLAQRCAFCREPLPRWQEEVDKNIMKRIKKNDPDAMTHMGKKLYEEGDFGKALEYWTNSVELGDTSAHFCVGGLYYDGNGWRRMRKKQFTTLNRQQSVVILRLEAILRFMSWKGMTNPIEQPNISSLTLTSDVISRWDTSKTFL